MKDIISNCFLCGEKSLHVAGQEEAQVMQCINCGYTTSTKYTGTKETNKDFQKLGEDMKNWAVEKNGKIWIPTVMALPVGMLHPINIKNKMIQKLDNIVTNSISHLPTQVGIKLPKLKKAGNSKPPKIKLPKLKKLTSEATV